MSLDLGPPLRTALIEAAAIVDSPLSKLSQWHNEPSVFTRRPVPADATDPMIIINPNAAMTDADGLTSERPIIVRDIAIYGTKAEPGDPADQTRIVEQIALDVRQLFHRKKFSIVVPGYSVIDVVAAGPIPAPVDDEATIGRLVTLTIRLVKRSEA